MANYKVVDADRLDGDLAAVADAIRDKTGAADALAFPEDYVSGVSGLHTFTPPGTLALDPEEVYRTTRPADWLPVPTPGDDEIFLLGMLMEGIDNCFRICLKFSGSCVIEFGDLTDGVFTARESATPVSGGYFAHPLSFEDYGNETAEGFRQYLIRIKGSGITEVLGNSDDINAPVSFVVEFACGIALAAFRANGPNASGGGNKTFAATRYIRFTGKGKPGHLSLPFTNCPALMAVCCEAVATPSYFSYTFSETRALLAVSGNLYAGKALEWNRSFQNSGIQALPPVQAQCKSLEYAFYNSALKVFPGDLLDTSVAQVMTSAFQNCYGLREVRSLDISALTGTNNMFRDCLTLQSVTFAGQTTPGGITIDLTYAPLSHRALVRMLQSLPAATAAAVVTLKNNEGAQSLTEDEIAIATAKNWTVTI